jgi:hypothetical protein
MRIIFSSDKGGVMWEKKRQLDTEDKFNIIDLGKENKTKV